MERPISEQMAKALARTLYVRMPHTIKSAKQVSDVLVGNPIIKMTRQSSRSCHVVFPSIEEKLKNLKNMTKIVIDGEHIIARPPRINPTGGKKKKEKKITVPKAKPEPRITKTLFIANIKPGTKPKDVKLAFPGCVSLVILNSKNSKTRNAMLTMGSIQLAGEYLRKEREWPEVKGNRLVIKPGTRKRKRTGKKKSSCLKIYDGEREITSQNQLKPTDSDESAKSETRQSDNSDDSVAEKWNSGEDTEDKKG